MPVKKRRMNRVRIGSSVNDSKNITIENPVSNCQTEVKPISGNGVGEDDKKKIIKEIAKCLNTLRPPNPNKTYKKKMFQSSKVKIGKGIENLI